jgi:RNA 3'-terminal phosphate cyclase (ATP)
MMLISNAKVRGCENGSLELFFDPSEVRPGEYFFDIGTAGSTSLLLQAILPPLVLSKDTSSLTLKGGTHVPFSPCFHYVSEVFFSTLNKAGLHVQARINKYGFYPKGGGEITVEILPDSEVKGLRFLQRGEIKAIKGFSGIGNLPVHIAERQRNAAINDLKKRGLNADIEIISAKSLSKGTFLFLKSETDKCSAGFSSLGATGKKAEQVGQEAAREFLNYYSTPSCLDPHLADQLPLYLAFSGDLSIYTASCITPHLMTNLWVMERFLGLKCSVEGKTGNSGKVTIKGKKSSLYS